MADKKISALDPASLPLAGTEVIPIVQGGETKKVAISQLSGAVDSVNGQTGVVVLDADNIAETPSRKWQSANQDTFNDATSSIQTQLDSKLSIETPTTTGVSLTFATDRIYGSIATPETGNITASVTGAKLGVTNIIIHNSGTAPTFDSKFKKLSGSGSYVVSVVNYIYCTYITATEIIYSINQRT